MLALSRKPGQALILRAGQYRIEIKLIKVRGDKVVLGFDAPAEVLIAREEVADPILRFADAQALKDHNAAVKTRLAMVADEASGLKAAG